VFGLKEGKIFLCYFAQDGIPMISERAIGATLGLELIF